MKPETKKKLNGLYVTHVRPVSDGSGSTFSLADHLRAARAIWGAGCRVTLWARSLGVPTPCDDFLVALDEAVSEGLTDQELNDLEHSLGAEDWGVYRLPDQEIDIGKSRPS